MVKYAITVAGKWPAVVMLDTHAAAPAIVGIIQSAEFGTGSIKGTQAGNVISGTMTLERREADFTATVDGDKIAGSICVGWFFKKDFAGSVSA